jgi:hypothetical protein
MRSAVPQQTGIRRWMSDLVNRSGLRSAAGKLPARRISGRSAVVRARWNIVEWAVPAAAYTSGSLGNSTVVADPDAPSRREKR